MKTRNNKLVSLNGNIKNKILTKTKATKVKKNKETIKDESYRESHNIGRRKSTSSVVTYSLDSRLFFDVYAKFNNETFPKDKNVYNGLYNRSPPIKNKTVKKISVSSTNHSTILPVKRQIHVDTVSETESTSNEIDDSKRPFKILKVSYEAKPINQDEACIPSPKIPSVSPIKYPKFKSIKKLNTEGRFIFTRNFKPQDECIRNTASTKDNIEPQTKPSKNETFQRLLENKTVFKKHLSQSIKETKKPLEKVVSPNSMASSKVDGKKRRLSLRLNKSLSESDIALLPMTPVTSQTDEIQLKEVSRRAESEERNSNSPCRGKRIASLNAAAIINCVQNLFSEPPSKRSPRRRISKPEETFEKSPNLIEHEKMGRDGNQETRERRAAVQNEKNKREDNIEENQNKEQRTENEVKKSKRNEEDNKKEVEKDEKENIKRKIQKENKEKIDNKTKKNKKMEKIEKIKRNVKRINENEIEKESEKKEKECKEKKMEKEKKYIERQIEIETEEKNKEKGNQQKKKDKENQEKKIEKENQVKKGGKENQERKDEHENKIKKGDKENQIKYREKENEVKKLEIHNQTRKKGVKEIFQKKKIKEKDNIKGIENNENKSKEIEIATQEEKETKKNKFVESGPKECEREKQQTVSVVKEKRNATSDLTTDVVSTVVGDNVTVEHKKSKIKRATTSGPMLAKFFDITTVSKKHNQQQQQPSGKRQVRSAGGKKLSAPHQSQTVLGSQTAADEDGTECKSLWQWEGEPFRKAIKVQLDGVLLERTCYQAIRHSRDDIVVTTSDCVMLRSSADQEPFLAKISAFYLDEDSGKKMMTLLWYYRPEHTELGRLPWHTEADVYASRHLDNNSVDCIEDKAFVLPVEMYSRFVAFQKRQSAGTRPGLAARLIPASNDDIVKLEPDDTKQGQQLGDPITDMFISSIYYTMGYQNSFPAEMTSSNVFVCRGLYDIFQQKITRNILQSLQSSQPEALEEKVDYDSADSAMSISSCETEPVTKIEPVEATSSSAPRRPLMSVGKCEVQPDVIEHVCTSLSATTTPPCSSTKLAVIDTPLTQLNTKIATIRQVSKSPITPSSIHSNTGIPSNKQSSTVISISSRSNFYIPVNSCSKAATFITNLKNSATPINNSSNTCIPNDSNRITEETLSNNHSITITNSLLPSINSFQHQLPKRLSSKPDIGNVPVSVTVPTPESVAQDSLVSSDDTVLALLSPLPTIVVNVAKDLSTDNGTETGVPKSTMALPPLPALKPILPPLPVTTRNYAVTSPAIPIETSTPQPTEAANGNLVAAPMYQQHQQRQPNGHP